MYNFAVEKKQYDAKKRQINLLSKPYGNFLIKKKKN
jgi:hypothetical protein